MDPATVVMLMCVGFGLLVEPGWRWHPHAKPHLEAQSKHGKPAEEQPAPPHAKGQEQPRDRGAMAGQAAAELSRSAAEVSRRVAAAAATGAAWLRTGTGAGVVVPCAVVSLLVLWRASGSAPDDVPAAAAETLKPEKEPLLSSSDDQASWTSAIPMSAMFLFGAGLGLLFAHKVYAQTRRGLDPRPDTGGAPHEPEPYGNRCRTPTLGNVYNSDVTDVMEDQDDEKVLVQQEPEEYQLWTPQVSHQETPRRLVSR